MAKDYYNILGVNKNATKEEIKKAYYKLAHKHHPHKGGDEAKMKEVNEAYGVLGNEQKRQQYDSFGQTFDGASGFGGQGFGGFSDFSEAFRNSGGQTSYEFNFNDIGDVFGDFFGGQRSRGRSSSRATGLDIQAELKVDFNDAVFGIEKKIKINKDIVCNHCTGSGGEPGSKVSTCSTCKGNGQVVRNIGFGIGFPSVCTSCNGQGSQVDKKCSNCRGSGVVKNDEEIKVKIPAGIDDGQTIKLVGKGAAGTRGSATGDLYLLIRVIPRPGFVRDGYDIRTVSDISFTQAALGDKIDVETISGPVKLNIPEGTQTNKIFNIKGKGVPHLNSNKRGDHLVKVVVKTPTRLSKKQKDALRELDE